MRYRAKIPEREQIKLDRAYLLNMMRLCHNSDPLSLECCGSCTENPNPRKRYHRDGWGGYT